MKTITMDFSEYETIIEAKDRAQEELKKYQKRVELVFGKEKANRIDEDYNRMVECRDRMEIHKAFTEGKL